MVIVYVFKISPDLKLTPIGCPISNHRSNLKSISIMIQLSIITTIGWIMHSPLVIRFDCRSSKISTEKILISSHQAVVPFLYTPSDYQPSMASKQLLPWIPGCPTAITWSNSGPIHYFMPSPVLNNQVLIWM